MWTCEHTTTANNTGNGMIKTLDLSNGSGLVRIIGRLLCRSVSQMLEENEKKKENTQQWPERI